MGNRHRLRSLDVYPVRWPLRRLFVTSLGAKIHSDNLIVRARLSGGAFGIGEASSSIAMAWQTQAKMAESLRRLALTFRGEDVRDMESVLGRAWAAEGESPTAVAAFETALWDALARAEGIPFYRLWGRSRCGLTTLMSIPVAAPEVVRQMVRGAWRSGFRRIKLKVNGRDPLRLDGERLRDAHRAAPRAKLLLDANQSYTPAALSHLLEQTRRDGIAVELVEEPFPKRDWRALSSYRKDRRAAGRVPVLLDESVQNAEDAALVKDRRLADGVNVKLAKSGLWGGKKIIEAFGKASRARFMIGCMAESKWGLAASVHFACGLGVFEYADLDSDLLLIPAKGRAGYVRRGPEIRLPKNPPPGLGIDWP